MTVGGWRFEEYEKKDDVSLVRALGREGLWSIDYSEKALAEAHSTLALMKTILKRGNYTEFTIDDVDENDAEDEGEPPTDHIAYMRRLVYEAKSSIEHHENALRRAYVELAAIQALLLRGKYQFTLDELRQEEKKRQEKRANK